MKTEDLRRNKERLLVMRQRLRDQYATIEEAIAEDLNAAGDLSRVPLHNADRDSEGLDVDLELGRNQGELLKDVEDSLQRIEDGTYGSCQECGQGINKERLNALPHTPYCVKCESAREAEQ